MSGKWAGISLQQTVPGAFVLGDVYVQRRIAELRSSPYRVLVETERLCIWEERKGKLYAYVHESLVR